MTQKSSRDNIKGFSLIELLVTVAIISVLTVVATVTLQSVKEKSLNNKVLDDLVAIANVLEQYKRDHFEKFPVPKTQDEDTATNQNVNCYYADATYAHDCDMAKFRQGFVDNALLSKRYLSEVPTDPRTGSRYAYGVSQDGYYFQVAGIIQRNDGTFEARTVDNLAKGFELPSLVRAYDGPNFVMNKGASLPYNPNAKTLTATLDNANGMVQVDGLEAINGQAVGQGQMIVTGADGSADLYLSDGSITHLDPGSTLELSHLEVAKNDREGIVTKVWLKVTSGTVWNKVVRLSQNSEFNVETSGAIAGSRGTEFAVDADLKKIILISGKVEVQKGVLGGALTGSPTSLEVTTTPLSLSVSGPLPTSGTPITGGEDMTRIQNHQTPDFHSMLVPYVTRMDRATPDQPFIVLSVGFNALTSPDYGDLEGFELFTDGQMETPLYTISETAPAGISAAMQYRYNPAARVYELSIPLGTPDAQTSRYISPILHLRAYGHGIKTQLSFRPAALRLPPEKPLASDFTVSYKWLSSVAHPETPGSTPAPVLNSLAANTQTTSGGIKYAVLGTPVSITPSITGTPTDYSWSNCTPGSGGATCSYTPDTAGSKTISLTLQPGGDTQSITIYTPAYASPNYLYSGAAGNNVTWTQANAACASLTEGGANTGTWNLPASATLNMTGEKTYWCGGTSTCPNLSNGTGIFVSDASNKALFASTNSVFTNAGPNTNLWYRCVLSK